jgi:hypothetical protein
MMLFLPSNFRGDPYGWVTNQAAHFLIGAALLTYVPTMICWWFLGEFPPKEWIIIWAGVVYAAYELIDQGWRGADTIEDWIFVAGYGATGVTFSFSEIAPGSPVAAFDMQAAWPFLVVMAIHLAFGAWLRRQ